MNEVLGIKVGNLQVARELAEDPAIAVDDSQLRIAVKRLERSLDKTRHKAVVGVERQHESSARELDQRVPGRWKSGRRQMQDRVARAAQAFEDT
jgi:hypothetical protein